MAEADHTVLNLSAVSPPNVVHDELGLGLPPWEIRSISQVLLPVLCAIFIAAVILVIACFLIQKKPKNSGVMRQKSCHTIETIPESSDNDIYDVIDEVRVRSFSPEKFQRRQNKMDGSGLLIHHGLHHSGKLNNALMNKQSNVSFNPASKFDLLTSKMSVRNSREWMLNNRESISNSARLSTNTESGVSSVSNDDDGIYETLDRHWAIKQVETEKGCVKSVDWRQVLERQLPDSQDVTTGNSSNGSEVTDPSSDSGSEGPTSNSNGASEEMDVASTREVRKLVCQISMFDITNTKDKPALIETSYYQVQPVSLPPTHASLPGVFHSSSLRIVQDGLKESHPERDIVLKHWNGEEILKRQLSNSPHRKNSQSDKNTKTYERVNKTNSKRVPTLIVKKSESFRTASSLLNTAKEQYRMSRRKSDSSDIDTSIMNGKSKCTHETVSSKHDVSRILTKLGPLPPLPTLYNGGNQNSSCGDGTETNPCHFVKNERKDSKKCNRLKTSSTSANCTSYSQTVVESHDLSKSDNLSFPENPKSATTSHQKFDLQFCDPTKQTNVDAGNFKDKMTAAVEICTEEDFKITRVNDDMEKPDADLGTISIENVCAISIDSVCDNEMLDGDGNGSNYYFVLEPGERTSCGSRNSDLSCSLNCGELGSPENMDSQ